MSIIVDFIVDNCDHEFVDAWDVRVRDLHETRGSVCVKCFVCSAVLAQEDEQPQNRTDDNLRSVFE